MSREMGIGGWSGGEWASEGNRGLNTSFQCLCIGETDTLLRLLQGLLKLEGM